MNSVWSTDHGLEIRILGSPLVERDGDPVEVEPAVLKVTSPMRPAPYSRPRRARVLCRRGRPKPRATHMKGWS